MSHPLRIALWNTEWASLRSKRGHVIRELIIAEAPDLVCLTEAAPDLVPDGGHLLTPSDEPRYRGCKNGEKVLLWSRWPWSRSKITLPGAAGGRFVEGRTGPQGDLRVTGVCIPWHDSRTRYGEVRRKRWDDHLEYIDALQEHEARAADGPSVLLGDYNQRAPRRRQPHRVFERLNRFLQGRALITAGWEDPTDALIDHVALSGGLTGSVTRIWPKVHDGLRLSDHVGVLAEVALP